MVEQLGKPVIKESELREGVDPRKFEVIPTGTRVSDIIPRGTVSGGRVFREDETQALAQSQREQAENRRQTTQLRNQQIRNLNVQRGQQIAQAEINLGRDVRGATSRNERLQIQENFRKNLALINQDFKTQSVSIKKSSLSELRGEVEKSPFLDIKGFAKKDELPFEKAIRVIPETAGRIVGAGVGLIPGTKKEEVTIGKIEVPQRRTIIEDRPEFVGRGFGDIGKLVTPELRETFQEGAVRTTEQTVAIGQFAIPILGEALFLGSLAEQPILAPEQFKENLKNNPVQTALMFSLGLLVVRGGIKRGLNVRDKRILKQEIKNVKTNFVAGADDETIKILSQTTVKGKPFISITELKTLKKEASKVSGVGASKTLRGVNKKDVELLLTQEGILAEKIPGTVKAVRKRLIPDEKGGLLGGLDVSFVRNIKTSPFIARGLSATRLRAVFNGRGGFNIRNGELVFLGKTIERQIIRNPKLIKSQVVGVISTTEAENLFKVIAGSPRLRIYKQGGVSYVFNPNINGWLLIKPGSSFTSSKDIVLRQIQETLPVLQASAERTVLAEARLTAQRGKGLIKEAVTTRTIGGNLKLSEIKKTITTPTGSLKLSELKKQGVSPSQASKPIITSKGVVSPKPIIKTKTFNSVLNKLDTQIKQKQSQIQRIKQSAVPDTALVRQGTQIRILQSSVQQLRLRQKQIQRLRLKQAQRLRLQQRLRTKLQQKFRPPKTPFIPFIPPPLPKKKPKKKKKGVKKPTAKGNFDIFTRKGGIDRKVGTKKTKKKAFSNLKKRLNVKLRASGFIVDRKTNKKVRPPLSPGFRRSKIRKNVLVEKRGLRLSSKLERESIARAKKLKSKSSSNKKRRKSFF